MTSLGSLAEGSWPFSLRRPFGLIDIGGEQNGRPWIFLGWRSWAFCRLVWLVGAHVTVHCWHTRKSVPREGISPVLAVHILVGLTETFRFAYLDLSHDPEAMPLDLAVCIVQSLTNAWLVHRMRRGLRYITPASYLAGALIRPTLSFLSYTHSLPSLHRTSVSAVDGFIYTRIYIFLLRFAPTWVKGSYARRYALSVVMAGCTGFLLGGSPLSGRVDGVDIGKDSMIWRTRVAGGRRDLVGVYLGLTAAIALSLWMLDLVGLSKQGNRSISDPQPTSAHGIPEEVPRIAWEAHGEGRECSTLPLTRVASSASQESDGDFSIPVTPLEETNERVLFRVDGSPWMDADHAECSNGAASRR